MNNPKRKHHYIPIFYLKGFTDTSGKLCVYSKDKTESYSEVLTGVSPAAIGYEKHGYTVKLPDGTTDSETIENIFAEKESNAALLLEKIIGGQKLADNEFSTFVSDFLVTMAIRTPTTRNMIKPIANTIIKEIALKAKDKEIFREYINNRRKNGYNIRFSDEEIETERQKYINIDGRYEVDKQESLMWLILMQDNFNQDFQRAYWRVIGPVGEYKFLTSDYPFIYIYEKSKNKKTYIMPLSKDYCIWGSSNSDFMKMNFKKRTNQIAKKFNYYIVKFAGRHIYCHFKAQSIYGLVKKYKDFRPEINELKVEELLKKNHG